MALTLAAYSALMRLARPLLRRKLARRAQQEPAYGQDVEQRFGNYRGLPPYQPHPEMPLVWVHAVSLGETRAAAILVHELREQIPALRLLLTHGTATGREEGRKLLLPGDIQVWQPWDDAGAVRSFLKRFCPAIGILMETEMWPSLVAGCRARGIPLMLVNARLNAKSHRGARQLGWLSRPAYGALSAVLAQTEADAARLRDLGAPVRAVLGNLKFDVQVDEWLLARGRAWRESQARPVVLLASSREGEEALWLDAVKQNAAAVQWLVVPRHPQRFDEVRALLANAGLSVSCRSQWGQEPASIPDAADVWLGDSMGEMHLYYGMAHAALLGGSFAPLGGQNLIEAAACGCPVVMGPHTFNFAQAAEASIEAGAALRAADMGDGVVKALQLAGDTLRQQAMAQAAMAFAESHRGAAKATAQLVAAKLEKTAGFVNSCFGADDSLSRFNS